MATQKTTKKSAKKATNQTSAKQRVSAAQKQAQLDAEATQRNSAANLSGQNVPSDASPAPASVRSPTAEERPFTLQAADIGTQKAASVEQQLATPPDSHLGTVTAQRVSVVEQAMAQRAQDLTQMQRDAEKAAASEQAVQAANAGLTGEMAATPRVPVAPGKDPAGIHPDVTSPTSATPAVDLPVPGTGVADPRDLAPGQDLTPSPPMSSSNILPQPNKPGSVYSKL